MLKVVKNPSRALTSSDVKNLEIELNVSLPIEYVEFLLRNNGGIPIPNTYPIEGHEEEVGSIQVFFGIDRDIKSSCLDWNFREFNVNKRIPNNLFPIGNSDTGDLICISLYGQDKGFVIFWDGMYESEKATYSNVYKIASSFSDFLNCLFEFK